MDFIVKSKRSIASLSQCEMVCLFVCFIVPDGKDILIQFLLKAAPLNVNFLNVKIC